VAAKGQPKSGGRQAGTVNKRTKELLAPLGDAAEISPKQVMLQAMRMHWNARPRRIDAAVECAAKAAPYVHPRLVAAAVSVRRLDEMNDDELTTAIAEAEQAGIDPALRGGVPSGDGETRH
jgi:hypothetical protein